MTENDPRGDILIVDDTPANLRLLAQMLTEQGYKVRPVPNGRLALNAVKAAHPDLILLDIKMPDMDGYAVCERLKADSQTADIPVIFISAMDQTQDKLKAFAAGGVDYVTKPFQLDEVLARVRTHLDLRRLQTELQSANVELERQLRELQARNEELDAFAHTVAHDLKNPLASIVGYTDLVVENFDALVKEGKVITYLEYVLESSNKMDAIIDELLMLSSVRKLEDAEIKPLKMGFVAAEAQARLAQMIQTSGAQIVAPEEWPVAMGYGPWVEEVWANYISNAIKYGGKPPRVLLCAEEMASGMIRFSVCDNGRGIAPEDMEKLFTIFTRLEDHDHVGGHGLGLSIVKRIIYKLGGEVGVESMVGEGSTFYFTLPKA